MDERAAFDAWCSDGGKWPRAVERFPDGAYKLAQAATAWTVWQARASLGTSPAPYQAMEKGEVIRFLRVNVLRHLSAEDIKEFRAWLSIYEPQEAPALPAAPMATLTDADYSAPMGGLTTAQGEGEGGVSDWNIPESPEALFEAGEARYWIKDRDCVGDNIYAMNLFLDAVGVPAEMVEEDSGTQVILFDGAKRLVIDSGGLGDFHLHGFDVTRLCGR